MAEVPKGGALLFNATSGDISPVNDARDELEAGMQLVDLITLIGRKMPNDEDKAISAGAYAALDRLGRAADLLREFVELERADAA